MLGLELDDLAIHDAIALLRAALGEPMARTVFFANANTLTIAAGSTKDRQILARSDFLFGDGTGVRWAARLGGVRLRSNLNGSDVVPALLAAANGDGRSCFLIGAGPEVVASAAAIIARRYPGWRVLGHHHGFLGVEADRRVRAVIAEAKPDLLLVGMGNPTQERWVAADECPARLTIGVGALFAYLSGDYRRAPLLLQRCGVEWAWVLLLQRRKWRRYIIGAPSFLVRILYERLANRHAP